jgi:hypothetical protein
MTGIREENTGCYDLKIYPVPFKDYLVIDRTMQVKCVEVFDLSGRQVFEGPVGSELPVTIETGHLKAGIYQFLITDINGEKISFKAFKI